MPLPPLAHVEDLEPHLGQDGFDVARVRSLLDAGSTRIRVFTGRMWEDPDEEGFSELQRDAVREVCIAYVQRVYRNPDGQTQVTTGPFARSVADWAAGGPDLSDDEKAELRAVIGSTGLWTVSTTRGPVETRSVGGAVRSGPLFGER